jgi:hypothetical protein
MDLGQPRSELVTLAWHRPDPVLCESYFSIDVPVTQLNWLADVFYIFNTIVLPQSR